MSFPNPPFAAAASRRAARFIAIPQTVTYDARVLLADGRALLDPVLAAHGFSFDAAKSERVSTAAFARGAYLKGDRRLELGCRDLLGTVAYQVGTLVLSHDAYMRAVLGPVGSNMYPSFSGEPLDGFRYLKHDLERYAAVFLHGSDEHFKGIVARAADIGDDRTTQYRR